MRQLLLATTLAAACTARTSTTPPPSPAPITLVRYLPGATRYRTVEHRHVEQVFQGQPIVTDLTTSLVLSSTLVRTDTGLSATIVVDSVAVTGRGGYAPTSVEAARGARFTAILGPGGAMTTFVGPEQSTDPLLQQLASAMQEFFPRLPPNGVRPGDQWIDTTEATNPAGGMVVTVRANNARKAIGWGQFAGLPALELTTQSDYVITGSGEQMGQALTLDGTGRRNARQFLSEDGRYLGGTAADTASIQVHLVASGITLPVTQQTVDTVTAVR
jgi:hypothetical protein